MRNKDRHNVLLMQSELAQQALGGLTQTDSSHGRTASNAAEEVDNESSNFLGDMYTAPTLIKTMAVHATKPYSTVFHLSNGERGVVLALALVIEELLADDDDDEDDDVSTSIDDDDNDGWSPNSTSML